MDRRLLLLAIGMFALGTDGCAVAGVRPEMARALGAGLAVVAFIVADFATMSIAAAAREPAPATA